MIVSLVLTLIACIHGQEQGGGTVSQVCLGCICEASSGCNTTIGCSGTVCGPFAITWAYWSDAGKPILNGESDTGEAYARCTSDPYCAARAVQGYMAKFAQDCTGDQRIDCDDYVRIHQLGGHGCSGPLNPTIESVYRKCMQAYG